MEIEWDNPLDGYYSSQQVLLFAPEKIDYSTSR
jgi:hypothetical protein